MKTIVSTVMVLAVLSGGCNSIRFAPGEHQKENAWQHYRACGLAADMAVKEETSPQFRKLTDLCSRQSLAFVADYGLPQNTTLPANTEEMTTPETFELADKALQDSTVRPDIWAAGDGFIELVIGLMALVGGAGGVRAVQFLNQVKTKTKALREIVEGNEIFKHQNPQAVEQFNAAQSGQSAGTKQIVTKLKS